MKVKDFLKLYTEDSLVQAAGEAIKPNKSKIIHFKGLKGSLDAVVASAVFSKNHQTHLFILHDKEEAAYFHTDIQYLLGDQKEVFLFPSSYKRPYQLEEMENANVLMRAEILNRINNKSAKGEIIITYPEALTEKVINKKTLVENTLKLKVGEQTDTEFLRELLISYNFSPTDFVYEAGQFAIRGGIIDIFSYAHDLPYRIELFGNELESIRTFEPVSQLSVDKVREINIIPNVEEKMKQESREAFLEFLPKHTKIWLKDYQHTLDVLDQYFEKATQSFEQIVEKSGNASLLKSPADLFETSETFSDQLDPYVRLEFGNRFYLKADQTIEFHSKPQPSFNKNFEILAQNLTENQDKHYTNIIVSEQIKQIERLESIFQDIDSFIKFQGLNIGLREGFIDENLKLACYTDHQIFDRYHRYKTVSKASKSKALTLKELRTLQTGDYVVHVDHGVGRFAGLEKVEVNGRVQEAMRLIYRDDDLLYVSVHSLHKVSKYSGKEGMPPSMSKLGSQDWENKKRKVKSKVKDIAKDLINLYAKRKDAPGFSFRPDGVMQVELESSFIYEDTPDQATATADVKSDMESPHPMDRLVCGDVGFGKTEVAIRAAFKAINDGKQVAILVPSTILAMQHYHTFCERLKDFPVKVEYINRFRSTKAVKEILKNVSAGSTDILIGTHRIVNKDVEFKDLGLMVIDEEQKFGVKIKEKLKEIKVNVDSLTLTATPIPRTLHFSLMGARDLSIIATPPPNRQPVTTEIHVYNEELVRDVVSYELRRGGQVFFVHNRVSDIEQWASIISRLVPDARVAVAHGQMEGSKLEKVMLKFIEGEYDVLVSTNIIEAGLDIPNANTIIINRAHMFGLSDLHQMRGRVGRSNKKAFCYLLSPPTSTLTAEARKRLSTLEEFTDLGSGFKVAMRDLDIRGAGNLLGAEQSGFISDIGFDLYHKILDEAVQELKETEFKELFEQEGQQTARPLVQDCSIETDMEIIIPDEYVSNIAERLSLYSKLDNLKDDEQLQKYSESLIDRFGPLPNPVKDLIETVKLRWKAEKLGFEKVILKNESMKCYLVPSDNAAYYQSEIFGKVLAYVQKNPKKCQLKEYPKRLMIKVKDIENVQQAIATLGKIL